MGYTYIKYSYITIYSHNPSISAIIPCLSSLLHQYRLISTCPWASKMRHFIKCIKLMCEPVVTICVWLCARVMHPQIAMQNSWTHVYSIMIFVLFPHTSSTTKYRKPYFWGILSYVLVEVHANLYLYNALYQEQLEIVCIILYCINYEHV
jgi:hypothetical protein